MQLRDLADLDDTVMGPQVAWEKPAPANGMYKILTTVLTLTSGILLAICGWLAQDAHSQILDLHKRLIAAEIRLAVAESGRAETDRRLKDIDQKLDRIVERLSTRGGIP